MRVGGKEEDLFHAGRAPGSLPCRRHPLRAKRPAEIQGAEGETCRSVVQNEYTSVEGIEHSRGFRRPRGVAPERQISRRSDVDTPRGRSEETGVKASGEDRDGQRYCREKGPYHDDLDLPIVGFDPPRRVIWSILPEAAPGRKRFLARISHRRRSRRL